MVSTTDSPTASATRRQVRIQNYPPGSLRFEWIAALLSAVFMAGLFIDGWAHNHGQVDQTFFTVWHAIFYSGFALCGLFLTWNATQNMGKGYAIVRSLPRGYILSLAGLFVFGIGGVGDLIWHTIFGIEDGTDALLSPTHLILAVGMGLIWTGPLRSALDRITIGSSPNWKQTGPAIISATLLLGLLMFFTQFAHPMVNPVSQISTNADQATSDIYVMNADGSRQTRLTNPSIQKIVWNPVLSHDGSKILYTAQDPKTEQPNVFIMNSDGTDSHPVIAHNVDETVDSGIWSPDGSQLAFTMMKGTDENSRGVFIAQADGSNVTTVISEGVDPGLAWSPDGKTIAYSVRKSGNLDVYVTNIEGDNQALIVDSPNDEIQPAFSPDGGKIAYTVLENGTPSVMVVNLDGSNPVRLATDSFAPQWSADGQNILFVALSDELFSLMTIKARGGETRNVSNNPGLQFRAGNYTPDGTQIIYAAENTAQSSSVGLLMPYGIGNILIQSAIMMGIVLLLVRQWKLPFGTLTVILSVGSLLISTQNDTYLFVPVMLVAGLISDFILMRLGWVAQQPIQFYLVGFTLPVVVYTIYFVVMQFTLGTGWTMHGVGGAIFLAGVVGLFAAVVMRPREQPANLVKSV